jgi:hypothetical protein
MLQELLVPEQQENVMLLQGACFKENKTKHPLTLPITLILQHGN